MDKKDLQYQLLTGKHEWTYYANNNERLKTIKELMIEGFPFAVELFFKAPAKFAGDNYIEFQNENFKLVVGLYRAIKYQDGQPVGKKKTEEEQLNNYADSVNAAIQSGTEKEVIDFLAKNIWRFCTPDILTICKRYHNRVLNDKQDKKEYRDFHKKSIVSIETFINELSDAKKEAENYFYQKELHDIYDALFSDKIDEKTQTYVKSLMDTHRKELFTPEFFERLKDEYKIIAWVETYLDVLFSIKWTENSQLVITMLFNSPMIDKVSENYIGKAFTKLDYQQQADLFLNIHSQKAYSILLRNYTKRFNKPDEVSRMFIEYLEKFPESGEAIYNVVDFAENGRSMINTLPELIEKYSKKWMLNYNYHNRDGEIVNVVEALESVNKIEALFFDFPFWKEMEKCNAFVRIVENLALSIGFDKCYDLIGKNYLASKAYGIQSLTSKWLQAAVNLAINNEEAQEEYVFFISNLIDDNSMLDSRSKDVLIRETFDYILKQASDSKKRAELEHTKLESAKGEVVNEIIHRICAPIERLEKMVMAYSDPSMPNAKEMLFMRDLVGKVRKGLDLAGIHPVENIDNWVKQNVIPYDQSKQECLEEIQAGDLVTCLSIGMMNNEKTYFEKATVKRYIGEK